MRPAAEGEDTAPQDVQYFLVAVGGLRPPNGQARSAWPNKGRGRLACPNPPCVAITAPARGSQSSLKGRWSAASAAPDRTRLPTGPCSILDVSRGPAPVPRLHSQGRSSARLDNRVRPASAVPPVRDEMGGAGRPGPVCGGMARRDIQPCSAAGRIALTSSGGGRCSRPEPGARPEG